MGRDGHPAATAAAGPAYFLAGLSLVLQELGLLGLRWSLVAPLILLAVGLVLVATGLVGAHRSRGTAAHR